MAGKRTRSVQGGGAGNAPLSTALGQPSRKEEAKPTTPSPPVASPRQWLLLVALVSSLGLLLGAVMMIFSLWSVAVQVSVPAVRFPSTAGAGAAPAPAPVPIQTVPGSAQPRPTLPPAAAAASLERRTRGSPAAPVVITEWFDFQCPGCGRFARNLEPEFERLYVETGKARYVARNFAFLGPESFLAAEAAEAASEQGKYWEYRKLLFERQRGENLGAFRPENLKQFAAELGLNQTLFNARLDQATFRDLVLAEVKEAESQGIKAVPTFFINGRLIDGIPTVDRLGKLIEEEIAKGR